MPTMPSSQGEEHLFQCSSVPTRHPDAGACVANGNGVAWASHTRAFSVPDLGLRPGWELVLGPPGCGKTQVLCDRACAHLDAGMPEKQILCLSYSRAAKHELLARLQAARPDLVEVDSMVCTIHGAAYRLLKNARGDIMVEKHWREFAARYHYKFKALEWDDDFEDLAARVPPRSTPDDLLRHAYDWGRNLELTVEQTLARYDAGPLLVSEFRAYVRRYEAFKKEQGLRDFIDLLLDVLADALSPEVSVFAIDEAQELSPLLRRVLFLWIEGCEHVYFGADDDQAIHGFQGGDPGWILELSKICKLTKLTQSRRVPREAHEVAQRIIGRNRARIPKDYQPKDGAGELLRLPREKVIALLDGSRSTFVLARNRMFLASIAHELIDRCIPFVVEGDGAPSPLSRGGLGIAARTAIAIHKHDSEGVPVASLEYLLRFVSDPRVLPSAAIRKVLANLAEQQRVLPVGELVAWYGLGPLFERIVAEGPFTCLERLTPRIRGYLNGLYARHGTIPEPRIVLTSIHGSKGRGAELVVVLPDMTTKSYRQYLGKDREEENRISYVAVTRTSNTLVLVDPVGRKHFDFPKPDREAGGQSSLKQPEADCDDT